MSEFLPGFCADPPPGLSCIAMLPRLPQIEAVLIVKMTDCAIWKLRAINPSRLSPAFAGTLVSTNKHLQASHMHGKHVKETSHPSREWIRVLWHTKLFNVWVANWYTRPALGQVFITAINLLAACYASARVRRMGRERESERETGGNQINAALCLGPSCILQPDKLCDCELSAKTLQEIYLTSMLHFASTI